MITAFHAGTTVDITRSERKRAAEEYLEETWRQKCGWHASDTG